MSPSTRPIRTEGCDPPKDVPLSTHPRSGTRDLSLRIHGQRSRASSYSRRNGNIRRCLFFVRVREGSPTRQGNVSFGIDRRRRRLPASSHFPAPALPPQPALERRPSSPGLLPPLPPPFSRTGSIWADPARVELGEAKAAAPRKTPNRFLCPARGRSSDSSRSP